jgi:predicted RNase H-like HicB family nuclease
MIKKRVPYSTKLPVNILREGKNFIAYTPALDLSTSGKTFEEAKKRFEEVVIIFFEELSQKGTLEEVLLGLGWEKVKEELQPPVQVASINEEIKIPANYLNA